MLPYIKTTHEWKTNEKTGERYSEKRQRRGRLYFLPERFVLEGAVGTELRARGIYEARLYRSDSQVSGQFRLPARLGLGDDLGFYRFEKPFLSVGISDIRGISNDLQLRLNGQTQSFAPGSGDDNFGAGVHAPLPALDAQSGQTLDFAFDLKLQGTEQLSVVPVGRDSRVKLSSDWPHPSFVGEYLPSRREISDKGFSAEWQTSFFATNLEEALRDCVGAERCQGLFGRNFGVSFVDPVDQYLKTDRAIKYALLFIALTFATFFLFEVLKRLAVHPMQYALVGLLLALGFMRLWYRSWAGISVCARRRVPGICWRGGLPDCFVNGRRNNGPVRGYIPRCGRRRACMVRRGGKPDEPGSPGARFYRLSEIPACRVRGSPG
ncbi:inner membrane protein, CreD family [Ectopseudomonas oleovorans]|uniref:Inner membrane protein, CreD family n=1 Tax=Ectopseudomonas oleovorans TaxID=301 RepID=A0A379KB95_ECTOL|nr:inner membrane protein, CreD family [Pseudomonas oleovorans]